MPDTTDTRELGKRLGDALAAADTGDTPGAGLVEHTTRGPSYGPAVDAVQPVLHAELAESQRTQAEGFLVEQRARQRAEQDYQRACEQIAAMHAAAVGETRGPARGVVEDIADVRSKVAAVRELHRRTHETAADSPHERTSGDYCEHCQIRDDDQWWPCDTIRALDGDGE